MKKLLLILLCLPLIGMAQNKDCDKEADYIMTVQDFIITMKNDKNNKKYDGKVFQLSINWEEDNYMKNYQRYGNKYYGSGILFYPSMGNYDLSIDFDFTNFSRGEYQYCQELTEKSKKVDYNSHIFTIKGIYSYNKSELKRDNYKKDKYQLINCCYVIPNKNQLNSVRTDTDKKEMYGVINDPDGYTNVREGKSSKSKIMFKVYEGEKFKIIDNSDDNWWRIEYNQQQGYMFKGRIDII